MRRFGTEYGGWSIPKKAELGPKSIVYSAGVGEDMSFDILLQQAYDCEIVLIDPTERAAKHYDEIRQFFASRKPYFSGDIQPDYVRTIGYARPNFGKMSYIKKGLWYCKNRLKFYKPMNPQYVSHTLIPNMYSTEYTEVEVDSIKNLMMELGHTKIDLLKLDIEGAEIAVVERALADGVFPRYLCIEFDLKLKGVDTTDLTEKLIYQLHEHGYDLLENHVWNCTFERN